MKLKHSLLFIALLSTTTVYATPVGAKLAGAKKDGEKEATANNACQFDIKFASKPQQKNQSIQASPKVSMDITQFVAKQTTNGAIIATNVMCQHMIGDKFTGSGEEFAQFIDNAIRGLIKAGFKDLKFTKVGTNDAAYKGALDYMEYVFTGDNGGNKQVIHNLAVLDKAKNQVITLSVSGNEKVTQEIKDEYQRLVNSFKP